MAIKTLQQIPVRAAERDPEGVALRYLGKGLTFTENEDIIARLVFVLRDQGVMPGDRVAIYLRKSPEAVQAAFAIMGAGAVYVPLDPTAPPERLAEIINRCTVRHVITDRSMHLKLSGLLDLSPSVSSVIGAALDDERPTVSWDEVRAAPRGVLVDRAPDDPAYIMFTSGSTGVPKGMVHTHGSGLSYLRAVVDLYEMNPSDRMSLHSGLHFDVSLWPIMGAPLVGAATVIVPDAFTRLPAEMSKLIEDEGITIWYSVPFALIQMLEQGALDKRKMPGLRWVVYAGEPFAPEPLRALMRIWPQARFSNNYGPAEVNAVTYQHIDHVHDVPDTGVPIGRAFPHTRTLVLDEDDQMVERGGEGELLLATPAMMQGYWDAPELTARGVHTRDGTLWYRSGDIVTEREDGVLNMLGRKDRQIKVRGARIELDEIELALNGHTDVLEAAAVASDDGAEIWAAVVLKPGATVTGTEIRAHAATRLPAYGVPALVEIMSDFPRTGSGKIDRLAITSQLRAAK